MTKNHDPYFTLASPIGPISVFFRRHPFCLTEIDLPRMDPGTLDVKTAPESMPIPDHPLAIDIVERMGLYFKGVPVHPPWAVLTLDGLTPLQRAVLKATADIPFGELRSYAQIATAIGRPRACRFVGTALSKNPFPILIPCHRVIRGDGSIGGFGSGVSLKRKLLAMEGIAATPRLRYPV